MLAESIETLKFQTLFQTIPLNYDDAKSIIVLANDHILLTGYFCASVYDEYFNLIKKKAFHQTDYIATNNKDKIFAIQNDCLVASFDFNLNRLKSVGHLEPNNRAIGISFSNNLLYVGDKQNKRIETLTDDLSILQSLQLDFEPSDFKVANNTLCIRNNAASLICFYSLNPWNLLFKYQDQGGRISLINSCFFQYDQRKKKYFCFNESGNLAEEVDVSRLDYFLNSYKLDGSILLFKDCLYLTSISKMKLIKLPLIWSKII